MATLRVKLTTAVHDFINTLPQTLGQQNPENLEWYCEMGNDTLGSVFLSREQASAFEKCAEELRKLVLPNFDGDTILSLCEKALLSTVDPEGKGGSLSYKKRKSVAVEALVDSLTASSVLWDVYFGVQNLSRSGLPLQVGHVQFFALNEEGVERILAGHDEISPESPDSDERKASIRGHALTLLTQEEHRNAAKVSVRANTQKAAQKLALAELRRTLDVLNFYADLVHTRPTIVYLPGEAARSGQFIFSYSHKGADENSSIDSGNYGSSIAGIWSDLQLVGRHLQKAQTRGFERACALLSRDEPNDVEKRILTAFHWAGRAAADKAIKSDYQEQLDAEREESFLFYAICLESLFVKQGEREDITKRLSARCAYLLGKDEEGREYVRKRLSNLYDRRSHIVHEGALTVGKEELKDIRSFACLSIIALLEKEEFVQMTTNQEYEQYFDSTPTN